MRRLPRTPAAWVPAALALVGIVLLAAEPGLHPHALAALAGFVVLGLPAGRPEVRACTAGILIVALGGDPGAPALLWLAAVAVGVQARGGRPSPAGGAGVLAVLASPLVVDGPAAGDVALLAGGAALLLGAGRVSPVPAELLRDPLTGLLSRAAFAAQVDRLAALAGPEAPAALAVVGLEASGEAQVASAAAALERGLRAGDVVARVDARELAVYAATDDPEGLAARLLAVLRREGLRAGAGLACAPRDGDRAATLLTAAGMALRLVERGDAHPYAVYAGEPLADPARGRRAALERFCAGDGLRAAVQPVVDVAVGEVHAYEARVRFSARGGEADAERWFGVAEELGCRVALERACLARALELLPGLPPRAALAVRASTALLGDPTALAMLEHRPGLDRLVLEVAEDDLAGGEDRGAIVRLREAGVRFALTGVGPGYAGLGRLAIVRPAYLVLDTPLVRELDERPDEAALVRALAGYAAETGCRVIAAGVETAGELAALRAAGIELVQGPLLGIPRAPWPVADRVRELRGALESAAN